MQEKDIDFRTKSIITVGSQAYNIVTDYGIKYGHPNLSIADNGSTIQIIKGIDKGQVIKPPNSKYDIAILEKTIDPTRNDTTLFILAGLATLGTMGSVRYLIDHWQELEKNYHNKEFALVLQFGPIDIQSFEDVLKNGKVVRRIPEN